MTRVCERCQVGRMVVYASARKGALQIRYMQCKKCGHKRRQPIPAAESLRRD